MASSLAKQLAQGASLNASLFVDRSRRQPSQSYLFTPRQADQHDLHSIHALGANGFQQLKSIEPKISIYEDTLFSDAAKATDRTLQTSEANQTLDTAVDGLLLLLGPHLLEAPSGKVLEWLVRRFRYVNIFWAATTT
jgi:U3 small nucleolar RNA-associated protein 10